MVLGLTPRAKRVLEYAEEEARRYGQDYIDTGYLLLGLLRDDGIGGSILEQLNVRTAECRVLIEQVGRPQGQ